MLFRSLNEPNLEMYESFSDGLKAKISASPEWQKLQQENNEANAAPETKEDDIPF